MKPNYRSGPSQMPTLPDRVFACGGYPQDWNTSKRSADVLATKGIPEPGLRNLICYGSPDFPFSITTIADAQFQTMPLLPAVPLHGFKKEIVFSHLKRRMFLEYPETPNGEVNGVNPWLSYLRQLFNEDRLSGAYLSVLAVAVGFFARIHKDLPLQRNGDRIYGQALRRVMEDIAGSPSAVDSCSISTGPLCLCIYELIRASGPLGWAQHTIGTAALVSFQYIPCPHRGEWEAI